MNSLLAESIFRNPISELFLPESYNPGIPYDVYEADDRMVVEFLVPGFNKEKLKLQFNEGILWLRGVRDKPQEARRYICRNMKILTDLSVSVKIGRNLEIETAKYIDGVLKVVLKRIDTMDSAPTIPIS